MTQTTNDWIKIQRYKEKEIYKFIGYRALNQIVEDEMLRSWPPQYNGKIICSCYDFEVCVKHDSWNEFGQGQLISLPLTVLPEQLKGRVALVDPIPVGDRPANIPPD